MSYDLITDGSNSIYLVGKFSSIVDFDPGSGTANLTATGAYDAFVLKLSTPLVNIEPTNPFNSIAVYPNPSDGKFSILTDLAEFEIIVHDLFGRMIYCGKNIREIDLGEESKGIYLVQILSDNLFSTQRVVVR